MSDQLSEAIEAIQAGKMVLIFDREDRECEVDMVLAAKHISAAKIFQMRRDGGGLICVPVHPNIAQNLSLPFLADLFKANYIAYPIYIRNYYYCMDF